MSQILTLKGRGKVIYVEMGEKPEWRVVTAVRINPHDQTCIQEYRRGQEYWVGVNLRTTVPIEELLWDSYGWLYAILKNGKHINLYRRYRAGDDYRNDGVDTKFEFRTPVKGAIFGLPDINSMSEEERAVVNQMLKEKYGAKLPTEPPVNYLIKEPYEGISYDPLSFDMRLYDKEQLDDEVAVVSAENKNEVYSDGNNSIANDKEYDKEVDLKNEDDGNDFLMKFIKSGFGTLYIFKLYFKFLKKIFGLYSKPFK